MKKIALALPSLLATLPLALHAQADPLPLQGSVSLYTSTHHLSAGYGDWHEAGVRGNVQQGQHLLRGEAAAMRRFGQAGTYLGVGDTFTWNADWFGSLSIGAGDGAFYLPRYRVDGFISRKLLPDRNLVATLGTGYYRAPDGHSDRNLSFGATYYFSEPWILQGEVRFNESNPGHVNTSQQFIAAIWGRAKQTQVTGRYGWGGEGYQLIGTGAPLVNFRSNQLSLAVRHWIGPRWGLEAAVERYRNPFYDRNGVTVGVFWELQ